MTWPWPRDSPRDRARMIANSLLALLPESDRDDAIRRARAVGESWLGANLLRWEISDVVSTAEAASLLHISPAMIRKWHSRGHLANRGTGRYLVKDVLDCAAHRKPD